MNDLVVAGISLLLVVVGYVAGCKVSLSRGYYSGFRSASRWYAYIGGFDYTKVGVTQDDAILQEDFMSDLYTPQEAVIRAHRCALWEEFNEFHEGQNGQSGGG
jgi:hypothetical protein